jgi:hypothetical protein
MARPTKAQVEQRTLEVLGIRLQGAAFWDVKEMIREREQALEKDDKQPNPWKLAEGAKSLSDGQIWRYIAKADKLMISDLLASRKKMLRRHRARREYLYGAAVQQGDVRAALSVLDSDARLCGLFPATSMELTGKRGKPLLPTLEEMVAALDREEKTNEDEPRED